MARGDATGAGGVTLLDIAAVTGLSKSVVSRALLNQPGVSPRTAERVKDAAAKLGYTPNPLARALVGASTRTIGLVLRSTADPFYAHLSAAVETEALRHDFRAISVGVGAGEQERYAEALDHLVGLRVDGLLVASSLIDTQTVVRTARRIPTVLVGRDAHDSGTLSSVGLSEQASRHLATALVNAGHVRIGLLQPPRQQSPTQFERVSETRDYLASLGLPYLHRQVEASEVADAVADLVDRGVTAIMCPDDSTAFTALAALDRLGVGVPSEVSVTGFDGVGAFAHPYFGLTTYRIPINVMAERAVAQLLAHIRDREEPVAHVLLDGVVMEGRTARIALG